MTEPTGDPLALALADVARWNGETLALEARIITHVRVRAELVDRCASAGLTRVKAKERMPRPKWLKAAAVGIPVGKGFHPAPLSQTLSRVSQGSC